MPETATLPSDVETALQGLLALPPEQRMIVGERLVASVPFQPTGAQQQEWERRVSELDANPLLAIDLDESMQRLREKLNAKRQAAPRG
jgi:hypothetical protein